MKTKNECKIVINTNRFTQMHHKQNGKLKRAYNQIIHKTSKLTTKGNSIFQFKNSNSEQEVNKVDFFTLL